MLTRPKFPHDLQVNIPRPHSAGGLASEPMSAVLQAFKGMPSLPPSQRLRIAEFAPLRGLNRRGASLRRWR